VSGPVGARLSLGDLFDPCRAPPLGTPGDPGLYGPGSAVWTIARERVLLAGGGAALLLQLAHPKVAAGVAQHSGFRREPFARLRSTLDAMLRLTFGDMDQALAAAREVTAVHRRVRGRLPTAAGPFEAGEPYAASDPDLALWVHATLVHTALDAFKRFVHRPERALAEGYYREAKVQAELFGVPASLLPADLTAFRAYVDEMIDSGPIAVSAEARALAPHVLRPPAPSSVRTAMAAMAIVTTGLLPERLRSDYGLPWGLTERTAFALIARGTRTAVPLLPANQRFWPHDRVARRRVATLNATVSSAPAFPLRGGPG
jgi:uncharacterized protein (DUF2236 family)